MFDSKKKSLFTTPTITSGEQSTMVTTNPFLLSALKNTSRTNEGGNGALKYTTSGSDFVDQFAKVTEYRQPRNYSEISEDMSLLWDQNPRLTISFVIYLRLITRTVKFPDGTRTSTTQRGQGLKHESIMRMIWLAVNHPEEFWNNVNLFVSAGSWKDIITMLSYDLQYNGWEKRVLNWEDFTGLILAGLENPETSELVKKYLPQIKSRSKCKTVVEQADTIIGKYLCSVIFADIENKVKSYEKYRKLKVSGTAHVWQQLISQGRFMEIDFDTVHGRALAQMVSGQFLKNNGLEETFEKWMASKPIAKYTGYVYELMQPVKSGYSNNVLKSYQEDTINKQFLGLIETAKKGMAGENPFITVVDTSSSMAGENPFITVVDTSASMTGLVPGTKISAYDIAKSMALYFSYLLKGPFNNHWMEFNNKCILKKWVGDTPVKKLQNDSSEAYGSTDFESVARTFVEVRQSGVKEEDFPGGILCLSDGCFNYTHSNEGNYKSFKKILLRGGFSKEFVDKFKIVLWDIPNGYYADRGAKFEEFADCPGMFHISGLDGSVVAFLMGTEYNPTVPKNSDELFLAAMNQEIMSRIVI